MLTLDSAYCYSHQQAEVNLAYHANFHSSSLQWFVTKKENQKKAMLVVWVGGELGGGGPGDQQQCKWKWTLSITCTNFLRLDLANSTVPCRICEWLGLRKACSHKVAQPRSYTDGKNEQLGGTHCAAKLIALVSCTHPLFVAPSLTLEWLCSWKNDRLLKVLNPSWVNNNNVLFYVHTQSAGYLEDVRSQRWSERPSLKSHLKGTVKLPRSP